MHPNDELIQRLYDRLAARDGEGMAACYADDATFEDPVFGKLNGDEIGAMWRMLTTRARSIDVHVAELVADDTSGAATCHATYPYGRKRMVHNVLHARFTFEDGKIVGHVDRFSLWRWSRMALGPAGLLFGWTPMMQRRIREQARRGLEHFHAKDAETSTTT